MYDAQWDPQGKGIIYCGSDHSTILFEPIWYSKQSTSKGEAKKLYQHSSKYAGVWKISSFIEDGHCMVSSVSSDGSVRAMFASLAMYFSKSHPGIFKCQELFRINGIKLEGSVALFSVGLDARRVESDNTHVIPSPVLSMNALDASSTCDASNEDSNGDGHSDEGKYRNQKILAYGGSAGLARIHVCDIPKY